MAWQGPKTDWDVNPKNPRAEDLNRIEGNIDFLKQDIETKKGLIVSAVNNIGGSTNINKTHQEIANEINSLKLSGNAITSQVLSGATFYAANPKSKQTGTIPSKGAQIFTPGTANQTIAAGQYLSGIQTILGDSDLIADNIKKGVDIFGKLGTLVEGIYYVQSGITIPAGGGTITIPILNADVAVIRGTIRSRTPTALRTRQGVSINQDLGGSTSSQLSITAIDFATGVMTVKGQYYNGSNWSDEAITALTIWAYKAT